MSISAIDLIIIIVLIILILFIIWVFNLNSYMKTNKCLNDDAIKILYRQAARWAVASEQDSNEIIKLLHANYATGYLWAIKDITSNDNFYRVTQEKFSDFENQIVKIQDQATNALVNKCKNVIPTTEHIFLKAMYSK